MRMYNCRLHHNLVAKPLKAARHGATRSGATRHGAARRGAARRRAARRGAARRGAARCGASRCGAARCGAAAKKTKQGHQQHAASSALRLNQGGGPGSM
jgi:hypothetical protein